MTTLVKVHGKGQLTLPAKLRSLAGISEGDLVQATFQRGRIVLTPTPPVVSRSRTLADDEPTSEGRRTIDRGIAQSEKEYREGRSFGPFSDHKDFIDSLRTEASKQRRKRTRSSK